MLDEFPALGRLDFFESALAFMAGYGIKAFLIAQSLNQIEKAYGQNNAILDNCHVRVAFATNDERTARRISDALGTATELRAMKNYAGHRLSPWLGHLMVSRQETARELLTTGEVMQLPAHEEIVMIAGNRPIRAGKARYFTDRRLTARLLPPPQPRPPHEPRSPAEERARAPAAASMQSSPSALACLRSVSAATGPRATLRASGAPAARQAADAANGGIRLEPELAAREEIVRSPRVPQAEFDFDADDGAAECARHPGLLMASAARNAALDPDDGVGL